MCVCVLSVSFRPRRIRNDFSVKRDIIMNARRVCRTFKNARENNRGDKLVMFSLKPCTTYLHNNNNNNTRDGYNKQKRKYSLRIENE